MEEKDNNHVQHDGEFVITSNGSKDFGEKHIERPERLQQLRDNGYENARDLVQDVATSFIARKNYFKNKTPLWVNPQNGV